MLRRAWERFPFDHEDIFLAATLIGAAIVVLIVAAVSAGIAYRLFEVTGGL